jgi:hypothetical protein
MRAFEFQKKKSSCGTGKSPTSSRVGAVSSGISFGQPT